MGFGFNPFKAVSGLFSGGARLFKGLFKGASGILSGIGSFLKPKIPEIEIPQPAPAPTTTAHAAAPDPDKEKSPAAEAERRRALAKYGRSTKTLLTGPKGVGSAIAGSKKLLGE